MANRKNVAPTEKGRKGRPRGRVVRHRSGAMVDLDAIEESFRRVGRHSCILCNGPGNVVGIWEPRPEQRARLSIPENINRLYQYLLCFACQRTPGSCQRIEEAILEDVRRRESMAEMG